MDDLEVYRKEIDSIDSEITKLFEKRMNTVLKVAEYKKLNNLPIFHKGREEAVIKKNIDRLENKDYEKEIEKFFNTETIKEVYSCKTTEEIIEILKKKNLDVIVLNSIADSIRERVKDRFDIDLNVIIVDMEGNILNSNYTKDLLKK